MFELMYENVVLERSCCSGELLMIVSLGLKM